MSSKKIITLYSVALFVFILVGESSAQKLNDLTPPSPKAYELGKYGQTPIGLFSGTVNASIPVYTYHTKNLSVPISLSYSSNGIKVDELGSNVGLGWNLNIGGAVTRIVRDMPDGDRNSICPIDKLHEPGGLAAIEVMNYFYDAGNTQNFDSETDLFMFNFNGYSGKFVYGNNHEIMMIPKQDIKIEPVATTNQDGYKITTPDGVVYTFFEKEYSRSRAEGAGHSFASFYVSAWYLSTIKHPNGDLINFVYDTEAYNYITSQQQSLMAMPVQINCGGSPVSQAPTIGGVVSYRLSVRGVCLKEINSNIPEEGKVLITTNTLHPEVTSYQLVSNIQVVDKNNQEIERADFTYITPPNKRVFLQKVAMKDPNNNHVLEYDDATNFPARLSYSQDHWGYFNGVSNSVIFPNLSDPKYAAPTVIASYNGGANKEIGTTYVAKGLLKRINYPTKGYSEFTYEPNTYSGTTVVYPPPVIANISVTSGAGQYGVEATPVTFGPVNMDQNAEITFGLTVDACSSGSPVAIFNIEDANNPNVSIFSKNFSAPGVANFALLAGHSYKIKIKATRPCMSASAAVKYYQGNASTQQVNIITGGVRVQKVTDNDGISATAKVTRYYYGKKESTGVSTGEQGLMPFYLSVSHNRNPCTIGEVDLISYEVSSNSVNALYNSMGTNTTGYNFVTISNGGELFENGGEEHEFILDSDAPAKCLQGDFISSAPWTNIGFANGKEKSMTIFKKISGTITVLKKQSNTYTQDPTPSAHKEVYGFVVQKKYTTAYTTPVTYTCTAEDAVRTYIHYECLTDHNIIYNNSHDTIHRDHSWGVSYFSQGAICILPDAINYKITVDDSCKGQVGGQKINPNAIENLNITEYKYNSNWEYLSSTTNIDYDLNGANPVTTTKTFFYDNPSHMQLTRTETTAGGTIQKEKMYYPDDVTTVTSLPGGDLQPAELSAITLLNKDNQYRINTPVQTESYLGTIKRNTVRTIYQTYNGLTLPSAVKTLKGDASSTNVLRDRVYYNAYDAKGNVVEALQTNDIFTSYLWGYNGLVPIAVAKNARANEIFFNGFEESNGWDGITAYDATNSHTGKYSGRIDKPTAGELTAMSTNTVIIPKRPVGKTVKYKYSCWAYSNGPSVDLFLFMKKPNEAAYYTFVTKAFTLVTNKWVYLEGEYDVADSITQLNIRIDNNGGGSVWFDDVRLHPSAAQMSTYTFQPLIGVTSATLPNQQLTKYEYDAYNRLKLIRNGDNAILQRSQYKFK